MQAGLFKTARKIILTIVVMAILFGAAGVGYVLLTDRNIDKKAAPTASKPNPPPELKPHQPSPDAPEGAAVESLVSPVAPGANSTITVDTNAGSACTIAVAYNNVSSKDSGLIPKTADSYGRVSWTWTVDKTAAAGKWPVKVTCTYHKRVGVVQGDLVVTK